MNAWHEKPALDGLGGGGNQKIFKLSIHSICTNENPLHTHCNKGEHTRCSYNKYMHGNAEDPHRNMPEDEHSKNKIASRVL